MPAYNDAVTVNSKPREIRADGKTYKVYPITFEDHAEIQAWLDKQQRDQVMLALEEAVHRSKLPIDVQKYMAEASLRILAQSRILLGTEESEAMLGSIDGVLELAYLGIRRGDPNFTRKDAEKLRGAILNQVLGQTLAIQIMDAADPLRADDPKSEATANGSPSPDSPPPLVSTGGLSTPS